MNFLVNFHRKFRLLCDNIFIYCELMTAAACNLQRISRIYVNDLLKNIYVLFSDIINTNIFKRIMPREQKMSHFGNSKT